MTSASDIRAAAGPPFISVIIITFNEEDSIRDCLDSLLDLDYPDEKYEIIVVDASTDRTPGIIASFERVRLLRAPKGFSVQKNEGLKASRGTIVAFTDADCIVPRDWLSVMARAFRDPRVTAVGGNAYPPPGTGRFGKWVASVGHPAGGSIGFDANVSCSPAGIEFVAGCNSGYRKSRLDIIGGFHSEFADGGEDVDLSRRLKEAGYFIDYIPDLTVFHKPRKTMRSYLRWNVQVGITKYNIRRPGPLKIIFQPSFPFWTACLLGSFLALPNFPWTQLTLGAVLYTAFLAVLWIKARPYPLLVKRRKTIGISLFSILTVVPALIFLRQECINIGQFKKWLGTMIGRSEPAT